MDTWQRRAVAVPELHDSRPFAHEHCIVAGPETLVEVQATAVRP